MSEVKTASFYGKKDVEELNNYGTHNPPQWRHCILYSRGVEHSNRSKYNLKQDRSNVIEKSNIFK